jgi:micrococcal nuclease
MMMIWLRSGGILMVATLLSSCAWVPTMVSQGVDAAITIGEHRSFYATAKDYATKGEIASRFADENFAVDVRTDVYQGRVMLTGLVKSAQTRQKAEELAQQVTDVRELFNDIQVNERGGILRTLNDLFIESKMKTKLVMAEGVKSINYRWRANNGMVCILGTADSPEELAHVVNIALETEGVREVVIHVTSQEVDEPDTDVIIAKENLPAGISIRQSATADFLRGEVISVYNGDSFTVMIGSKLEKVRLIGSDAPDMTQSPIGRQARELLGHLVRGKMVSLETDDHRRDKDNRLLAYVYVGDLFVNLELIRQGHAVMDTKPPNVTHVLEYQNAQVEAQAWHRGVWSSTKLVDGHTDCRRNPVKGREC